MATRKPLEIFINPGPSKKPELVRTRIKLKPKIRIPITALTPSTVKRGNRIYLPRKKQVDIRDLNDPIPEEPLGEIRIIRPEEQRFGPNEDVQINEVERRMPTPEFKPWDPNKLSERYKQGIVQGDPDDPYNILRQFGRTLGNDASSSSSNGRDGSLPKQLVVLDALAKIVSKELLQQQSAKQVKGTSEEQTQVPKKSQTITIRQENAYSPASPVPDSTSLHENPNPRVSVQVPVDQSSQKRNEAPVQPTPARPVTATITLTTPTPKPTVDLTPETSPGSQKVPGLPQPTAHDTVSAALSTNQGKQVDATLEAAKNQRVRVQPPPPPVHNQRTTRVRYTALPQREQPFGGNPEAVKGDTPYPFEYKNKIYYFKNDDDLMKAFALMDALEKPGMKLRGKGIIDLHLPHLSPVYFSNGGDYFSNGVYQNFF